jgi:hypothetical protein
LGSNIHGLDAGKSDYCVEMVKELRLKRPDIFPPARRGKKPIEIRTIA